MEILLPVREKTLSVNLNRNFARNVIPKLVEIKEKTIPGLESQI